MSEVKYTEVHLSIHGRLLEGELGVPSHNIKGLVLFVHGSGSSHLSPRNRLVAEKLQQAGFVTLLFDLLSREEDHDLRNRFDISLLTQRVIAVTKWVDSRIDLKGLPLGFFGASTGAAAALRAAASLGSSVRAVVSRGGRPDLAYDELEGLTSPTLFIVGGLDPEVIDLNREAFKALAVKKKMVVIPGASHLFEEPGKIEEMAEVALEWFDTFIPIAQINQSISAQSLSSGSN